MRFFRSVFSTCSHKMIRVVIDIRESDLWSELAPYHTPSEAEGWYAERATLDVGDIAFYLETEATATAAVAAAEDLSGANAAPIPLVVLERKTADDLGASQKDGRYREQRARLLALKGAKTAVGYVVEAPHWSASLTRTWCRGAFTEVHLQQTIIRIQMRYGISVFQAESLKETIRWIRRISKMLAVDPSVFQTGVAASACEAAAVYTKAIHVKKADNNTPERIFLSFLMSIPGLGRTAATAVAEVCENRLTLLQAMTTEQISDIKCGKKRLGAALGKVLYEALHA